MVLTLYVFVTTCAWHSAPPAVLNSASVARELLSIILAVCREWLEQFPRLTAPEDKPELSMFGMKNTRRKMEDRYALCLDVNSLYALKVIFILMGKESAPLSRTILL